MYLHAGLAGGSIDKRYIGLVSKLSFKPAIAELPRKFGLPAIDRVEVTEPKRELLRSPQGSIFHSGVRKRIYHVKVPTKIDDTVEQLVEGFYANARTVMRRTVTRAKGS